MLLDFYLKNKIQLILPLPIVAKVVETVEIAKNYGNCSRNKAHQNIMSRKYSGGKNVPFINSDAY